MFMLRQDFPVILRSIYPWGLGMFFPDVCDSWICILKTFYNHHTTRCGGLTVKMEGPVLTRVLECAFIYSHSHIIANSFPQSGGCTNARLYEEWDPTTDISNDVIIADGTMTSS